LKTLHGYVLREHLNPLIFSLTLLVSIFMMNQIVIHFDKIVGKGLDLTVIFEFFVLCIPFILATTMPMAVLVSTLWAFGRLSSDNEIIAMKAGGVSLFSLLRPLLLAAFLMTILMIWFNNSILPNANFSFRSILMDISYQKPTLEIKEGILMDDLSGYSLLVQKIDRQDSRLYDITIYDTSVEGAPRTILANEGEMFFSQNREDLILKLNNGEIHLVDPDNMRNYQRVEFQTQTIVIKGVGTQFQRREHGSYRTDREMSSAMMIDEIDNNNSKIHSLRSKIRELVVAEVDTLFLPAISGEKAAKADQVRPPPSPTEQALHRVRRNSISIQKKERELEALTKRNHQLQVEVHKKYSIPFAIIIFILLGAPLRLNFKSGGAGSVIVLSLIAFVSYYIFLVGGENLGDRGYIPPYLAMWAPNLLFGALGIALHVKTARETSSLSLDVLNPLTWFRKKEALSVEGP
jgi:lipopolysaccharide export system permease protein